MHMSSFLKSLVPFDLQFVWRLEFVTFIFSCKEKKTSKNFSLLLKEHNSSKVSLQFLCWCRSWRSQARKVHNGKVKLARQHWKASNWSCKTWRVKELNEIRKLEIWLRTKQRKWMILPLHQRYTTFWLGNALEWDFSIVESQGKLATDTKSKAYTRIEQGKTRKPCLINPDWKNPCLRSLTFIINECHLIGTLMCTPCTQV